QRHLDLPAVAQSGEQPLRLGIVGHRKRKRNALESRLAHAAAVGSHQRGLADAEARMHHLVLGTGRDHAGLRGLGSVLPAHQSCDLGADCLAVELEGLLAATVEEQVRLDLHGISLWFWGSELEFPDDLSPRSPFKTNESP